MPIGEGIVKVKYDNFELVTRARTLGRPFRDAQDVIPHLAELLARTEAGTRKVRLLGVSFSALGRTQTPLAGQLDLFMPD